MTAQLGFDNCVIGSNTIATSAFVRGGSYSPASQIAEQDTADGKLHQIPLYKGGTASVKLYGDQLAVNSAVGLGGTVTLKQGSTTLASGTGLASASYDEATNTTDIQIKLDPSTDTET